MNLLFDDPAIAGLDYEEDVISEGEEEQLLDRLLGMELAPFRFHGFIGNRKTVSFGWRYDFDDASFTRTEPIPDWLEPLRDNAAVEPERAVHLEHAIDRGERAPQHRDREADDRAVQPALAAPPHQ